MIRLFHSPGSRSTRIVWMLEEVGAEYELVFMGRDRRTDAAHLARHPLGRVPVVELADGTFVFESVAVALLLADAHPDAGLIGPLGSDARALAYQWSVFAVTEVEAALLALRRAARAEEDLTATREPVEAVLVALAQALGEGDWLLGEAFGVADVLVASVLDRPHRLGLLDATPTLAAYVERAQARPAYVRAAEAGALRPS